MKPKPATSEHLMVYHRKTKPSDIYINFDINRAYTLTHSQCFILPLINNIGQLHSLMEQSHLRQIYSRRVASKHLNLLTCLCEALSQHPDR